MSAADHSLSSQPTPGAFVAHGSSVWTHDGTIQIANCASRQLCPAGNAANARKLAQGSEALDVLAELVWCLDGGEDSRDAYIAATVLLERAGLLRLAKRADLQVAA